MNSAELRYCPRRNCTHCVCVCVRPAKGDSERMGMRDDGPARSVTLYIVLRDSALVLALTARLTFSIIKRREQGGVVVVSVRNGRQRADSGQGKELFAFWQPTIKSFYDDDDDDDD